jgi:S-DNA-T family DNA segregation ATPase FtsK/SpoIIIE
VLPNLDEILEPGVEVVDDGENDRQRANVIEETLRSFGAPVHIVEIRKGPAITLFGVEPDFVESRNGKTRVRVSKITALADDLALALAASRIRIQAPVPGKGYIGIEVPNRQISLVALRDVIASPAFQKLDSPLKLGLGKDVAGNVVAADLTSMPHLLIAGTTGAGKSVCINDILTCFLLNMTPDELRLILVDPKRVELTSYNGIPHLLAPVIVDAEHVVGALQWMLREMDNRYRKFSESHSRNIGDYNAYCARIGEKKLPYLLIVIDELADLMMLAPDETERAITRLAQLARATGIHLIIATQRPSTDILTGLIKANFPARIAFAVASSVDSRVILDQPGAERLLGRGDMLFQAPDASAPVRIQGAYVSDAEIGRLAAYWRGLTVAEDAPERPDQPAAFQTGNSLPVKQAPLWEEMEEEKDLDPKFDEAVQIVREEGQASISMLQRKMRIGYTRSARMIDKMEEKGIVGPPDPKTQIREIIPNEEESE